MFVKELGPFHLLIFSGKTSVSLEAKTCLGSSLPPLGSEGSKKSLNVLDQKSLNDHS